MVLLLGGLSFGIYEPIKSQLVHVPSRASSVGTIIWYAWGGKRRVSAWADVSIWRPYIRLCNVWFRNLL